MKEKNKHRLAGLPKKVPFLSTLLMVLFYVLFIIPVSFLEARAESSTYTAPELSVSFLNQDPDPAEPGNFFKARFKIENIGLGEARDVQLEILPEYPFSIYQDSQVKKVTSISSRQKSAEAVFVEYIIKAGENTVPGNYSIKLRYKIGNSEWTTLEPFSVNVKEHKVVVSLSDVETEPETAKPGEKIKLKIQFENLANTPVKYLTVRLGLVSTLSTSSSITVTELPFSPQQSSDEVVFPLVRPKEIVTSEFSLMVDPDAEAKVYKVPVTYSYTDPSNINYSKQNYVSIAVSGKPELSVYVDSSSVYKAGMAGEVVIKFVNRGLNDIKFLYAKLAQQQDYELLSPTEAYVGNIDSDDYETLEYRIYAGKGAKEQLKFPLEIEYKDVNNNEYKQNIELNVKLYTEEEAKNIGLEKNGKFWQFAVLLVVPVIGYLIYRKLRKRK